jgi:hypothetical protein
MIEETHYANDEIVSIEFVGEEEVYDIEVQQDHSYIASGLVVHNSSEPLKKGFIREILCQKCPKRGNSYQVKLGTIPYQRFYLDNSR